MKSQIIRICREIPDHADAVEILNHNAFGPGRFTRTAYRLREGVRHEEQLSFIATVSGPGEPDKMAGSVRQTKIRIGNRPALLLGPLVVAPKFKNIGIGRELMNRTIDAAREAGHELIILVGDFPYYSRFGFEIAPTGRITLPGPVDPQRLLVCMLARNSGTQLCGRAKAMLQKDNTG